MKLLAVSTSAKMPSAAILREDGSIECRRDESMKPHSVSLMPLIDKLLDDEGMTLNDFDAFCVDVGPGSFTGIRIGVSIINAFAFANDKKVIPVCSLAALRHLAGQNSSVICMLDARNGNGYAAVYCCGECIIEPCACVQGDIIAACEALGIMDDDGYLIGDCMDQQDSVDAGLIIKEALFAIHHDPVNCAVDHAVPMYLRPSQAERMKQNLS